MKLIPQGNKTARFLLLAGGAAIGVALATAAFTTRPGAAQSLRIETDGGYLGIEMEDVTAADVAKFKLSHETGVIVRRVEPDSPAEAAGLQADDVILQYEGIPVFSSIQFARLVRETPVGRSATLVVSRDGKKIDLAAKIAEQSRSLRFGRGIEVLPREFGRSPRIIIPGGGASVPGFEFELRERNRLGVALQPLTEQMAEFLGVPGGRGVLVASVEKDGPAASVLKAGDVIAAADGKPVDNPQDLSAMLRRQSPGAKIDLKVIRDRSEISVSVVLSKGSGYRM